MTAILGSLKFLSGERAGPPARRGRPAQAGSRAANENLAGREGWIRRVLVVEDEFLTGLDLTNLLIELGYEVCAVARHAVEAVAFAAELHPDLVLMDIHLRGSDGVDGIQAADEIRARFGIPSLYLSGRSDPATRRRAAATRPLGYLLKPCSPEQLDAALREAERLLTA